MVQKKSNSHVGAIVAGIAGLTAAGIGAYYLYGSKNAAKNRAQIKGWMLKAKGEVLEKLENVQDITESAYFSAIDTVSDKYNKLKNIDPAELAVFMDQMKGHWKGIKKTWKKPVKKSAVKKTSAKK